MYHNWFRYGDVEVANNIRVQQYVANGLKPTGTYIAPCDDCGDLPTVVDGVPEYRTPELDLAPWVRGNDFDAGDFAGVMIKEVTGLEGSTTQVEVVEKVGDGGAIGTRRAASRTVAVTADVVARTREAASLGLEWLGAALHPPCSPGGDCAGGVLHMFSACPMACVGQTDQDSAPITTTYGDSTMFQTTAIIAKPQPVVTNIVPKPSAEPVAAAVTPWTVSNSAFGAYVVGGSLSFAAPPVPLSRASAVRVVAPALADGQSMGLLSNSIIPESGWWEYSAWVYVPAACTLSLAGGRLFGEASASTDVKDRWIRLSARGNMTTGDSTYLAISAKNNTGAAIAAGQVFWVDGGSLRKIGAPQPGADGQGRLSTDVEGWFGSNVFGSFTAAIGVTNVAFASPNAFNSSQTNPKSIRIAWAANKGTTQGHAAYSNLEGLEIDRVYTVECDVYLTAGCADMESDILFNGKGQRITTKGQWVHVRNTFAATNVWHSFGFTSAAGQDMAGAGQFMYVANVRLWPGFSAPPLHYYDGATLDTPLTNLATGIAPIGLSGLTVTPDVVHDDDLWYRLEAPAGAVTARLSVPEASLLDGAEYRASWLVYNEEPYPQTFTTDWADTTPVPVTIPPFEERRIYAQGRRDYDATFRFTDLQFAPGAAGRSVLVREIEVVPVQPTDFAWTGTADNSNSTATQLGDDFIFKPDAGDSLLLGPVLPGVCDHIEIEWLVSSSMGSDVEVFAAPSTPDGTLLSEGDRYIINGTPTPIRWMGDATPNFPDDWRPTLTTVPVPGQGLNGRQITIHGLKVTHRPVLSVEECVTPYRRTLHNVVTVEGPKVLEWLTLGDETEGSTVARVEWTWVATDPHLWHDPIPLLTDVQGKTNALPAYQAPGVPLSNTTNSAVNATACPRPAATALTCADNPIGPAIVLPPQAPVLADLNVMDLAGTNRTRRDFEIPVEASPIGLGKLSWRFINDGKPKFGIRVRIWDDTLPGFLPEPECEFAEEFTIEYLGPNQVLYIDGPGEDAYVYCGDDTLGNPIYAPALKNLRGNYGGPFQNSVIGCGRPYHISVEVPNTYTAVPSNLSGLGAGTDQGDVLWSVDLIRRA